MLAHDDIWLAGFNIPVQHWTGSQWNDVPVPGGVTSAYALDFSQPADGWAVASWRDTGVPVMLHWDGNAWAQ
jgi:hypothetical protein